MEEKNRLIRAWIWLWYNDFTRLPIMFGLPLVPLFFTLRWCGVEAVLLREILSIVYMASLGLMLIYNDYSNLRRIGLDEYRRPLSIPKTVSTQCCLPCRTDGIHLRARGS